MIRIGTSSWADPEFVRDWYPPKLPAAARLSWYAQHFDYVERFNHDYSDEEIAGVATRVCDLDAETEEVHVAFNNNYSLYAPKAALRLKVAMGFA